MVEPPKGGRWAVSPVSVAGYAIDLDSGALGPPHFSGEVINDVKLCIDGRPERPRNDPPASRPKSAITWSGGTAAYLKNGGSLENAAAMANHASTRTTQLTTQLYDRQELVSCGYACRRNSAARTRSRNCSGVLVGLYGHFGLVRLSRLGHDVSWVKA
jgi:hypothetical protein